MSRFRVNDVMWELAEFSRELLQEMQQLLGYHRASAYKEETSGRLLHTMGQVQALFDILGDDFLSDLIADVEAMEASAGQNSLPGECSLTARAQHLIKHGAPALEQYQKRVANNRRLLNEETLKVISHHRRALLSVCKQGTRSWELLKSFS